MTSQWMTRESAPTDGTRVLGTEVGGRYPSVMYFRKASYDAEGYWAYQHNHERVIAGPVLWHPLTPDTPEGT